MRNAKLKSVLSLCLLALLISACNKTKEISSDQVMKFYSKQITCMNYSIVEAGLKSSTGDNVEFQLPDFVKTNVINDKAKNAQFMSFIDKMVKKDGFEISDPENMKSKFGEQIQDKIQTYIRSGLHLQYQLKEERKVDIKEELLEYVHYFKNKEDCNQLLNEIDPPKPVDKSNMQDKIEVPKPSVPISSDDVISEYKKQMTCISDILIQDFDESYGPDSYAVKLQLERYPADELARVVPFIKYLLKGDNRAISDIDKLPMTIKNNTISRINFYRANEEPEVTLKESVDYQLQKPECLSVKKQMADRISAVSPIGNSKIEEVTPLSESIESSKTLRSEYYQTELLKTSHEQKGKFKPNPDTLPANNDVLEVVVTSAAPDFSNQQMAFKIGVTNLSSGKIIYPVTRNGKELKETGFQNNAFVPNYRLENVFTGVKMVDDFNNEYPLTFFGPLAAVESSMEAPNNIQPGEGMEFLATFQGIPVKNSHFIKLVFSREFTNSSKLEIKIRTH